MSRVRCRMHRSLLHKRPVGRRRTFQGCGGCWCLLFFQSTRRHIQATQPPERVDLFTILGGFLLRSLGLSLSSLTFEAIDPGSLVLTLNPKPGVLIGASVPGPNSHPPTPTLTSAPDFKFQTRIHAVALWEFPKIGGTLFWGPYNKDPIHIRALLGY